MSSDTKHLKQGQLPKHPNFHLPVDNVAPAETAIPSLLVLAANFTRPTDMLTTEHNPQNDPGSFMQLPQTYIWASNVKATLLPFLASVTSR